MDLNWEKIQRRIGNNKGGTAGGGGMSAAAISQMLAGYATEAWVDENYLSIEFFNRIFTIHGTDNNTDVDVEPNDLETTITSIEAMFGFWTEYYVSALGNGGDLGSAIYLSSLADVAITSPISDGQVLQYNLSTGKWTNATLNLGSLTLSGLSDVLLTTPSANQVLLYDGSSQKWINSALKTINGQPIYGSGDISVGGGASGNYLPLAGGTMTGRITFSNGKGGFIEADSVGLCYQSGNTNWIYVKPSDGIELHGNVNCQSIFIGNSNEINGTSNSLWLNYNGVPLYACNGSNCYIGYSGSSNDNGKLNVNGSAYVKGGMKLSNICIEVDNNIGNNSSRMSEINNYNDAIYMQWNSTKNIRVCKDSNSKMAVGTESPSYKLHVAGTIYATGSVTALSDARKKDVIGEKMIGVEQIAGAPAVQFLWKGERAKEGLQVGTLAQYWQGVLPEVVMDRGDELSMQYGVAAMVSAIVTARKVVDHERRITELERENERLKKEIEQLRLN